MPAPHSHDAFEETIYGLEGVSTWTVDGETIEIGPGEAVCVPRSAIHGFENRGNSNVKFLAIATPGVFGPDYFHEVGEVLAASAGGPPDLAAVAEVMRHHGLTPAPPVPRSPWTPATRGKLADQHERPTRPSGEDETREAPQILTLQLAGITAGN